MHLARSIILALGAAFIVTLGPAACSHSYDQVSLTLAAQGTSPVGVAVLDARPYIHGQAKQPNFVGVQRSLGGLPVDVTTASGKPMADDWAQSIAAALRARGFDARIVQTSNSMERPDVVRLLSTTADRSLLIRVRDWKVDAHFSGQLWYEISAQVIDASGTVKAETGVGGKDDFPPDLNGATNARDRSATEFKMKIEQLLNDPKIVDALK